MKMKLTALSLIAALTLFGAACDSDSDADVDADADVPEVEVPEVPGPPEVPDVDAGGGG